MARGFVGWSEDVSAMTSVDVLEATYRLDRRPQHLLDLSDVLGVL